jgi:xanthine dehydrogenase YagS FAD-binding subunit
MNPFQYVTATTADEATSLIGQNGRYLGGGVDLLGEMKDYIASPDMLVALRMPPSTSKVRPVTEVLQVAGGPPNDRWIDSAITMAELSVHPEIKAKFSALAEAASEVGSPQIRNVATLGGNLLQHSRCWYYRQPDITCLKRGGQTCYAQEGENKYSSLFSGCACISPVVSNTSIALSAVGAEVHLSQKNKSTPVSLEKLYSEAWTNPAAHHSLKPSDLVDGIIVSSKRTRSAYRQISEKREFDWALVSCAAAGNVTGGKITDARVVLGAVAPVPYMVEEANKFLEGQLLTDETASKAADLILKDAKPLAQNGYKVPLAHTLIRRTLLALNP